VQVVPHAASHGRYSDHFSLSSIRAKFDFPFFGATLFLSSLFYCLSGSYLAHTQGKRHQENIGRRAAREAQRLNAAPSLTIKKPTRPKAPRIGRPGFAMMHLHCTEFLLMLSCSYRVTKQYDSETGSRSLLFQVEYPQIGSDLQPRHRFMSAYEQKVEAPDRNFQYLLVAAEPYETIGFKIPSLEIDRGEGKFFSHWDREKFVLTLQMHFKKPSGVSSDGNPQI
jgi:splicing factor 3A subunit 2